MPNEYIRIGRVQRPHGIRGAIKLEMLTENPSRYDGLERVFIERQGAYVAHAVIESAVRNDCAYLSLEGVGDRDAAEAFRDAFVCIPRDEVTLPDGHWFVDDLIGCAVSDTDGKPLGVLTDVLQYGAADVYVIAGGPRGLMVPALKKLLHEVATDEKRIVLAADVLQQVAVWDD